MPVQQLFIKAITCHQQGKLVEAQAYYQQVLQLQPQHFDALYYAGLIAAQSKNFTEAVELFAQAIISNPEHAQVYYDHGRALIDLKRYQEALQSCQQAIKLNPHYLPAIYNQGYVLQQLGHYQEAIERYQQVLRLQPDNASAYNSIGLVLHQLKHYQAALENYQRAFTLQPGYAEAFNNHGNTLQKIDQYQAALASYQQALTIAPDYADAWNNFGLAQTSLKQYDAAIKSFQCAINLDASQADVYLNLGHAQFELKLYFAALASFQRAINLQPDLAEAYYYQALVHNQLEDHSTAILLSEQAVTLKPDYAEAYHQSGLAYYRLKNYEAALASYEQAIISNADYAEAYYNRGNVLLALQNYDQALTSYAHALKLKSDDAQAWNSHGNALYNLKRYTEALYSYQQSTSLQPDFTEAYQNQANCWQNLKQHQQALVNYQQVLALQPEAATAWYSQGNALFGLRRYAEALLSYERALALQPNLDYLLGYYLFCKLFICDWRDLSRHLTQLESRILKSEKAAAPFTALVLLENPSLQQKIAAVWAKDYHVETINVVQRQPAHRRIKIAYLSADFYNHATAHLTAGLFEAHDKEKFEIIAVSFCHESNDPMRQRLKQAFEHFVDVRTLSDQAVADLLKQWQVDIVVDLGGYTKDSRTAILALRPAAIQMSYLGYPSTMAADFIDYLIADRYLIPEADQQYYQEKIIYLPNSYQVNDDKRQIAEYQFTRAELNLPETGFVFCCFNNSYKISPELFVLWMQLLKQVPDSVLWLLASSEEAEANLRREAERLAVDANRLVFAPRLAQEYHLARHQLADLFLDTLPYNAHTTATDALWAGLPIVTCLGKTFAGRVAASLLHAIDLPELITDNLSDYAALALRLANDSQQLAAIKNKLWQHRQSKALFATDLFRQHLESAYTSVYTRQQNGLAAESFYVAWA